MSFELQTITSPFYLFLQHQWCADGSFWTSYIVEIDRASVVTQMRNENVFSFASCCRLWYQRSFRNVFFSIIALLMGEQRNLNSIQNEKTHLCTFIKLGFLHTTSARTRMLWTALTLFFDHFERWPLIIWSHLKFLHRLLKFPIFFRDWWKDKTWVVEVEMDYEYST